MTIGERGRLKQDKTKQNKKKTVRDNEGSIIKDIITKTIVRPEVQTGHIILTLDHRTSQNILIKKKQTNMRILI